MSLISGYLTKSPPRKSDDFIQFKRWKKRFCELKIISGNLIFEYRKLKSSKTIKGLINFNEVKYLVCNFPFMGNRRNMFAMKVISGNNSRIFYFNALSVDEFKQWMRTCVVNLKFIKSAMTMDIAQELIVSGFFVKSSTKGSMEYAEMFVHSLEMYQSKVPEKTHECKQFFEVSKLETCDFSTDLERRNTQLPIRCTSTMNSESSSDSDDSETDDKVSDELNVCYIDSSDLDLQRMIKPFKCKDHTDSVTYCDIDQERTEAIYKLNKRLANQNKL